MQRDTGMDGNVWQEARRWQDRWEAINPVGDGRLGVAYLARRAGDRDQTPCFLKVLKEQEKLQRRKQMAREAAALHALRHPRIPRLVESNAHRHAATEEFALYLVTDYVPGPRLDQVVGRRGSLPGGAALALTGHLLDAIAYCHARNRVHSDI